MFQKLFYYIIISRPINCLITFASIFIAGIITVRWNSEWMNIILAGTSGVLACASGNIINDIFDNDIDVINKPQRMLPSGKISIKEAWLLYFVLNIAAVLLSVYINFSALLIVISTVIMLFLYSYRLKNVILAGNITIAFLTGLTFIYGGVAVNSIKEAIIPAVFAFLINFIREIVKDMEDIEGDYKYNIVTFPKKFGNLKSIGIIFILACLLFIATFVPFVLRIYRIEYFISVMILVNVSLVYFLNSIIKDQSRKNLNKLSLILKINMIFGLFSIYLGV